MSKIKLKKILTKQNKPIVLPLLALFFAVLYLGSGAISNQFGSLLPLLEWEKLVPFLPWSIWIYMVFYPIYLGLCIVVLLKNNNHEILNKTIYGFILLTILSCFIFVLLPISYPRMNYPLSLDDNLTNLIFRLVRKTDTPSNCLPSLHVGLCFYFAWCTLKVSKKFFNFGIFSSIIISISTLTTKQHYFYDIIAGFLLATLIFWLIDRYTKITGIFSK